MYKLMLFLIVYIFCSSCEAQDKHPEKRKKELISRPEYPVGHKDNLLGFGCFEDGSPTKSVILFSKLLEKKDYTTITNKLVHENPTEKYLATLVCIRLQEKKLIELSDNELKRINDNKKSSDLVSLCDGCTEREVLNIKELFDPEWNPLYERAQTWLNESIR